MIKLQNIISILNWVDPAYSLEHLSRLKSEGEALEQLISTFRNHKRKQLIKIYNSVVAALDRGNHILCSTDDSYPEALRGVFKCPVPLMYKGNLDLNGLNLSVVGSRRPQHSTNEWLERELFEALEQFNKKKVNINIFSGGAYGVDQVAHSIALFAGVPTTCFLPTGINNCYPKSLSAMIKNIVNNNGAIISPFPPDFPIYKSNFYFRNKILVLLSDIIFIAEARRRSGTIMTANMAVSSGKPIIALPQAAINNCLGSLDLIQTGVPLVKCKKDLIFNIDRLLNF